MINYLVEPSLSNDYTTNCILHRLIKEKNSKKIHFSPFTMDFDVFFQKVDLMYINDFEFFLPCFNNDGKTDCFTKNVVYSLDCITCEVANDEVGKKAVTCYIGETSRSLHCRGAEHWDGFQGKKENSPLYKHAVDAHCGEVGKVKFRMRILKQHFTAMGRQIHESVAIARRSLSGVNLINSKMEGAYNRCKLPRLTIGGSEGQNVPSVDNGGSTFEIDKEREKAVVGKAKPEKKTTAGSSVVSRQVASQSTLQKYFHSKSAKFR